MFDRVLAKGSAVGRLVAAALAALLCVQMMPLYAFSDTGSSDANVTPTSVGDFEFSMHWVGAEDSSFYEWNATQDETKNVRLSVNYASTEVTDGYDAGAIEISVPGIGGAYRYGTMEASSVSADAADSTEKVYDWSYSYDADADVYSFTNNNAIPAGSSFSGSFEILWKMESRSTVNGYAKDIAATVTAQSASQTEAQRATGSAVRFAFTSEVDSYAVDAPYGPLSAADGLPSDYEDWIWVEYELNGESTVKARGLSNAAYVLTLEDGAVLQSARNSYGYDVAFSAQTDGTYRIDKTSGANDWTWQKEPVVIVGYPKATYDGLETELGLAIVGTHYDTSEEVILAEATVAHTLTYEDYAFDYEGELYSIRKSKSIDIDALEYDTLFDGVTVEYYLNATARVAPGSNYTVSLIDDFQDVLLNDGTIHELEKYDYYVQQVVIPDADQITNSLGQFPEDGEYTCEVWYDMGSGFNKLRTYELARYSTPSLTLPYGTKAIKLSFPNVNEVMNISGVIVKVRYILPDELKETAGDASDVLSGRASDTGRVRNVAGLVVTDADGNLQNTVGLESYEGNLGEYVAERDLEAYGHYVQRSFVDVPVVPLDDEWSHSTGVSVADWTADSSGFYSEVRMSTYVGEEGAVSEVTNLTQYTVLPLGMDAGDGVFSPTFEPYDAVLSSGTEVTADYLSEHATVEVVGDYRGSGRTYVAVHYDFSDDPLAFDYPDGIAVKFPVEVSLFSYLEHGSSYLLEAASIFHSATGTQLTGNYGGYDDGAWFSDASLWSDLDGDGSVAEPLSYRSADTEIVLALATHQEVSESVRADSDHKWGTATYADYGEGYSWRLQMVTGSSSVQDLVMFDGLVGEGDWDGSFAGVDVSYLEAQGYAPTIYYSADTNAPFDVANASWVESDSWALASSDVAAVAVALHGQTVPARSLAYAQVLMTAPQDESLDGSTARDSYTARFTPIDSDSGVALDAETLVSGEVTVTLGEEPVVIDPADLPKTDVILTKMAAAPDGTPLGIPMAYVYFSLYKADGTLISSGLETDSNGQILVEDLEAGSYYFLETYTEEGYVKNAEKISFTIDQTNASETVPVEVEVLNLRKGGDVRLVKIDQDGNLVEGAVFSLYESDGTLVAEGLTTDANGRIDYGGLDWLSYYFVETDAPEGYEFDATAKHEFDITWRTVGSAVVVTVKNERVQDTAEELGGTVTVMKRIAEADVHWEHGEPTFVFKLTGADSGRTLYEQVRFTPDCVVDAEGFLNLSAVFTGLEAGEWELSEVDAIRYGLAEASSQTGIVEDGSVTFNLSEGAAGEATFVNEKEVHEGLSDTALVVNSVNGPENDAADAGSTGESYAVLTDDYKLTFLDLDAAPAVGDDFEGASVLAVYEGRTADATGYEEKAFMGQQDMPWYSYMRKIVEVEVRDEVNPISTAYWFYYFDSMTTADVAKINMTNVFDMEYMFYNCKVLENANVSGWQTGMLEDARYAFYNCKVLTADCSAWDVSNVTSRSSFNTNASGVTAPVWVN